MNATVRRTATVKRLAALAAVGTVGILAPVSSASAATLPALPKPKAFSLPVPRYPLTGAGLPAGLGAGLGGGLAGGLAGFTPAPLSFVGPSLGQVAAVIGPTVITTAPSTFINTNIQVSAGSNLSGGQAG